MPLGTIALLLAASFSLGALPLTGWAVRVFTRRDLRALGTGNVGVSAAFIHGGKLAGIAAVLAEIVRGITPVLAGRFWFPDAPEIAIALLIPLVAGRYAIARGGGVTNAVWGLLVFSPPVAVSSGIWGLVAWGLAQRWWGEGDRARLFASRCGCLCTPIWVWVWRQSIPEFLAAAGLALLLAAINFSQGDDMALSKSEPLFSLDDSLDAAICGDKAAKLSQLKRAGFNVPAGFVLASKEEGRGKKEEGRGKKEEGRRKKEEGRGKKEEGRGKKEEGRRNEEEGRGKKEEGRGKKEEGRRNEEEGRGKKEEGRRNEENADRLLISNSVIQNLKSQIPNRMIVRSSAAGEDGDTSSAAGQYQTIGPVFTEAELLDAINRCRQSYWTSEAVAYRRERQLPDTQMAVLIQPYIHSQIAGVMFSRNPLDGGSQIIIEALPGGAESVVGGQVTPLHWEIDFSAPETLEKNLREIEIYSIVDKEIIAELVQQAQAIEAFFHGIPQDIEWSWDGEKVWILQSRPITNLQPFWTRTIAAEVIPGAIRPLTWSINRPLTCGVWGEIFRVVLGDRASHLNFNETATLLGSHAYFNATLLGEIFRMMGLPEQGLEFLLRGQKMGKPPLGKILPSLPGLWRLVQRERALNADFEVDRTSIFLPALQSLQKAEGSSTSLRVKREKREEGEEWAIANYQYLSELLERAEQIQEWLKPITYYNILGRSGWQFAKQFFAWLMNGLPMILLRKLPLSELCSNYLTSCEKLRFCNLTRLFQSPS